MKQFIAIALGSVLGILGITGWRAFAGFLVVLIVVSTFYINHSEIPDDVLTGLEALQEGLMASLMTFTVRLNYLLEKLEITYLYKFCLSFLLFLQLFWTIMFTIQRSTFGSAFGVSSVDAV